MRGRRADRSQWEQWRKLITEAARSESSIREFCRQRQITEAQFYAWRTRLNGKRNGVARRQAMSPGKAATFALVSDAPEGMDAGIELVLADGRRVRINRGVDEATLRTVWSVVGAAAC